MNTISTQIPQNDVSHLSRETLLADNNHAEENYDEALSAFVSNPLLSHAHWSTQLQLTARNNATVMEKYEFVNAQTIATTLYPDWTVKNPQAAIEKQAQRQALLSIDTKEGKLYPVEQFDLTAKNPSLLAELKSLLSKTAAQKITHMELLHWLCAPVTITIGHPAHNFEEHINEGDLEAALQDIADKGPSKTVDLVPLDIARQGNTVLFEQLLSLWLSPEPMTITKEQRETAVQYLKAQMVALGITELSLR